MKRDLLAFMACKPWDSSESAGTEVMPLIDFMIL